MFKSMRVVALFDMLFNPGDISFSERVRAKRFIGAFKLGFLQLICKEYHLLQILTDLPIKHLTKLILYESAVKL